MPTSLTAYQFRQFCDAVESLVRAGDDGVAARRALLRVKLALLPLPLDSPVRAAVGNQHRYGTAGSVPVQERAHALLCLVATPPPDTVDAATGEVVAAVKRRLLAEPSRSAGELDTLTAADPLAAGLIRLADPERGPRYLDFQFDPGGGAPLPVVQQVNRLLLADQDPWGAADWWLGGNRWPAGTPAELIGRVPDALLMAAARAMVEED